MATIIRHRKKIKPNLKERYEDLISNKDYREAIFFNTSDAGAIKARLKIAKNYLID